MRGPGLRPLVRPGLRVIFVGYNPSIPAFQTGHYYANPTNHFYTLLHESGLTTRLLSAREDDQLLNFGIGVCDLVSLPSAGAADVPNSAFRAGAKRLRQILVELAPQAIALNGYGVYRHFFGRAPFRVGRQLDQNLGSSALFVMPSSSGAANGLFFERLVAYRELSMFLAEGER